MRTSPRTPAGRVRALAVPALAAALTLSACGGSTETDEATDAGSATGGGAPSVVDPIVTTYDGGLYVLDPTTLEIVEDIALDGFNRLNPAGDDRHLFVSTSSGFQVLDAAAPELTDLEFEGPKPGHVVRHAGRTVLFFDGSGEVVIFDTDSLGGSLPEADTYTTPEPHHGVAVELSTGELVTTLGNEDERPGIVVLDGDGEEIARNEDCPGVHGEATAQGEAVVIGCETGVLIYRDGEITKVDSPTDYGRIGNQAGSEESSITLGDYKQDPDAELERPTQISLIDTENASVELVELGTSYTFRSLARGPEGEALVLGTDGAIHVIDPETAEVVDTISVIDEWEEPLEWQQPRPAIFVRGGTAFVSDPSATEIHAVDLESGEITATGSLPSAPNELSGTLS
ncbi:zinc metallochaperone AztD [Actinoalloteichus spitiensis]|uniref:zinc metallochaperone AztD n=1 Tax=Actinoalloteichus spitiensis TaxID=252394 RepID=UPI000381820D|nr:zinc metallochaperone AztD [Actinoalloteichus spitiensis]